MLADMGFEQAKIQSALANCNDVSEAVMMLLTMPEGTSLGPVDDDTVLIEAVQASEREAKEMFRRQQQEDEEFEAALAASLSMEDASAMEWDAAVARSEQPSPDVIQHDAGLEALLQWPGVSAEETAELKKATSRPNSRTDRPSRPGSRSSPSKPKDSKAEETVQVDDLDMWNSRQGGVVSPALLPPITGSSKFGSSRSDAAGFGLKGDGGRLGSSAGLCSAGLGRSGKGALSRLDRLEPLDHFAMGPSSAGLGNRPQDDLFGVRSPLGGSRRGLTGSGSMPALSASRGGQLMQHSRSPAGADRVCASLGSTLRTTNASGSLGVAGGALMGDARPGSRGGGRPTSRGGMCA